MWCSRHYIYRGHKGGKREREVERQIVEFVGYIIVFENNRYFTIDSVTLRKYKNIVREGRKFLRKTINTLEIVVFQIIFEIVKFKFNLSIYWYLQELK